MQPPSRQALVQFRTSIYAEHLDEATALYELRCSALERNDLFWTDLIGFEERLEPHLDALLVGGGAALDVCKEALQNEATAGTFYVVASLLCRTGKVNAIPDLAILAKPGSRLSLEALADAIATNSPPGWEVIPPFTAPTSPQLLWIAARVSGLRREGNIHTLLAAARSICDCSEALVWACGRLGDSEAKEFLLSQLRVQTEPFLEQEVALALLRMGELKALTGHYGPVDGTHWPPGLLALAGDRGAGQSVFRTATGDNDPARIISAGWLGNPLVVDDLLDILDYPEFSEAASHAWFALTGAELMDEIELDAEEDVEGVTKARGPEDDLPGEGEELKPPLERIVVLSRKREVWADWWMKNRSRFSHGRRYQFGHEASPLSCLDLLESPSSPRFLRSLGVEELAVRYGVDCGFETASFVHAQKGAIRRLRNAQGHGTRLGLWYVAGYPTQDLS